MKWANKDCASYLPDKAPIGSFLSAVKSARDDSDAYSVALAFYQAIEASRKSSRSEEKRTPRISLKTHRYDDGSVRVFNPYNGYTYAYYGADKAGQPFYFGDEDYNKTGRAGFMGTGGIFDQVSDGDALNYQSKKNYRMKSAA